MERELKLLGTPEMNELVSILVGECGCGCSLRDSELVSPTPDCAAMRGLRDRRFILGMLFARRLRRQLGLRKARAHRCRPGPAAGSPARQRPTRLRTHASPVVVAQHGVWCPTGGTT